MIDWKVLDPKTAGEEIEEDTYLIKTKDRIISATHDAMNGWFIYSIEDGDCIVYYRNITHYAEINLPQAIGTTETA